MQQNQHRNDCPAQNTAQAVATEVANGTPNGVGFPVIEGRSGGSVPKLRQSDETGTIHRANTQNMELEMGQVFGKFVPI
jgi:hypothetical protein